MMLTPCWQRSSQSKHEAGSHEAERQNEGQGVAEINMATSDSGQGSTTRMDHETASVLSSSSTHSAPRRLTSHLGTKPLSSIKAPARLASLLAASQALRGTFCLRVLPEIVPPPLSTPLPHGCQNPSQPAALCLGFTSLQNVFWFPVSSYLPMQSVYLLWVTAICMKLSWGIGTFFYLIFCDIYHRACT